MPNTKQREWEEEFDERFTDDGFTTSDAAYCEDAASRSEGCWKLKHIKSFISQVEDKAFERGRKQKGSSFREGYETGLREGKELKEETIVKWDKLEDELYCIFGECRACFNSSVANGSKFCNKCGRKIVMIQNKK